MSADYFEDITSSLQAEITPHVTDAFGGFIVEPVRTRFGVWEWRIHESRRSRTSRRWVSIYVLPDQLPKEGDAPGVLEVWEYATSVEGLMRKRVLSEQLYSLWDAAKIVASLDSASMFEPVDSSWGEVQAPVDALPASRLRQLTDGGGGAMVIDQARTVHVIPSEEGWEVRREGGGSDMMVSTHRTQAEAEKAGRDIARNAGGEFVLHRRDGRIRARDSYGPPKG